MPGCSAPAAGSASAAIPEEADDSRMLIPSMPAASKNSATDHNSRPTRAAPPRVNRFADAAHRGRRSNKRLRLLGRNQKRKRQQARRGEQYVVGPTGN